MDGHNLKRFLAENNLDNHDSNVMSRLSQAWDAEKHRRIPLPRTDSLGRESMTRADSLSREKSSPYGGYGGGDITSMLGNVARTEAPPTALGRMGRSSFNGEATPPQRNSPHHRNGQKAQHEPPFIRVKGQGNTGGVDLASLRLADPTLPPGPPPSYDHVFSSAPAPPVEPPAPPADPPPQPPPPTRPPPPPDAPSDVLRKSKMRKIDGTPPAPPSDPPPPPPPGEPPARPTTTPPAPPSLAPSDRRGTPTKSRVEPASQAKTAKPPTTVQISEKVVEKSRMMPVEMDKSQPPPTAARAVEKPVERPEIVVPKIVYKPPPPPPSALALMAKECSKNEPEIARRGVEPFEVGTRVVSAGGDLGVAHSLTLGTVVIKSRGGCFMERPRSGVRRALLFVVDPATFFTPPNKTVIAYLLSHAYIATWTSKEHASQDAHDELLAAWLGRRHVKNIVCSLGKADMDGKTKNLKKVWAKAEGWTAANTVLLDSSKEAPAKHRSNAIIVNPSVGGGKDGVKATDLLKIVKDAVGSETDIRQHIDDHVVGAWKTGAWEQPATPYVYPEEKAEVSGTFIPRGVELKAPSTAAISSALNQIGSECTALSVFLAGRSAGIIHKDASAAGKGKGAKLSWRDRKRPRAIPKLKVFCDLDGVLADFDAAAASLNITAQSWKDDKKGSWNTLKDHGDFFGTLPWTKDGHELWEALKPYKPTVLTGVPQGKWAEGQKMRWCKENLGKDVKVISCRRFMKADYAAPNAVIIDDNEQTCDEWRKKNGIAVKHHTAQASIDDFDRELFALEGAEGIENGEQSTASPSSRQPGRGVRPSGGHGGASKRSGSFGGRGGGGSNNSGGGNSGMGNGSRGRGAGRGQRRDGMRPMNTRK